MTSYLKVFKGNILIFVSVYATMWFCYYLDKIIGFQFGIYPRVFNFENIFGIFLSWTSHSNISHISGNSIALAPILLSMCFFEKHLFRILSLMAFLSGLITWLLGEEHSFHLGASGMVFAGFGYILSQVILAKNILYLIPVCLSLFYYGINYYSSMLGGLIPQNGISFAGHLGGIVSGIISSFIGEYRNITKKLSYIK